VNKTRWQQIQSSCKKFLQTGTFTFQIYDKEKYLQEKQGWQHVTFSKAHDRAIDFMVGLSECNNALREIRNREPDVHGNCDVFVRDDLIVSYTIKPETLPKEKVHCGPFLEMPEAVETFKAIYGEAAFEQNGRICTVLQRDRTDVSGWMKELISERMKNRGYRL
jgi:hypothetical protein